jgi:3-deoxy-manno-octulosonate cytidylyltransferase (CMP-KDO synthetase)
VTGFDVLIPARYAASRLPGKPLCRIGDRSLIARVVDRARASGAERVAVATDDEAVAGAAREAGAEALLTRGDCASGTDRLAEAAERLGLAPERPVVNVQGDEPFMPPALIREVALALEGDEPREMATVAHPFPEGADVGDPHAVKVVRGLGGDALYFSRAPIPWARADAGGEASAPLQHVGLYAYRAGFLERFAGWPPTPLECTEGLEQLRALENGVAIRVVISDHSPGIGVDTQEDLERARALVNEPDC